MMKTIDKDMLKAVSKLPEEDQVYLLGGLDVDGIKDSIHTTYSSFHGGMDVSVDEHLSKLGVSEALRQMPLTAVVAFTTQRIGDYYQFIRTPALSTAAKSVSGFHESVVKALQVQQEIEQKYGMLGAQAGVGVALGARAFFMGRDALATFRALRRARGVEEALRVLRIGLTAGRAGLRTLEAGSTVVSALAAPESGGLSLVVRAILQETLFAAMGFVLEKAGEVAGRRIARGHAIEMSGITLASDLLDRQRLINEFDAYSAALASIEGGFDYNNGIDILQNKYLNRVSNLGASPLELGYDVQSISSILRTLAGNYQGSDVLGYASTIASLASVYGIGQEDLAITLSNIGMSGANAKYADRATELFGNFYAAVSGGEGQYLSQLSLVSQLASFSRNYGASRYIGGDGGGRQLAAIASFMMSGPQGRIQSVEPTLNIVQSLDNVLMQGFSLENPRARELLNLSGVPFDSGLFGLLGNEDLFNKVLGGIQRYTGIGEGSFDSEGQLSDDKAIPLYNYVVHSLGMSPESVQPIAASLYSFVHGNRATLPTGELPDAGEAASAPVYSMISTMAKGQVELSDAVMKYMDVYDKMDELMYELYGYTTPFLVKQVGNFAEYTAEALKRMSNGELYTKTDILDSYDASNSQRPENRTTLPDMSKDEFFSRLVSAAEKAEEETGRKVNIPVLLAQAAFETGFGTSRLAREDLNLFGIKVGTGATSEFRKYNTLEESVADYIRLLSVNSYYADALRFTEDEDYEKAITALMPKYDASGRVIESGYTPDLGYRENVIRIVRDYDLTDYERFEPENITFNVDIGEGVLMDTQSFSDNLVEELR